MPPRRRGLTEADRSAWAAYTRMVAPLPGRATEIIAATAMATPPLPDGTPRAGMITAPPPRPHRPPATPLEVGGQPGGLDRATWQRLRAGKLVTERTLDLHGMTVQHAYQSLVSFLRGAHAQRLRCVEIITGRGSGETGGAIRREFPHWLNRPDLRPLVLGAAHPHAQNPGSVRLLLRRAR